MSRPQAETFACTGCGVSFVPTDAARARNQRRCTECRRLKGLRWRARCREQGRPYKSQKMPREWHRQWEAKNLKKPGVRARRAENRRRFVPSAEQVLKMSARSVLRGAIRRGKVVPGPCEVCGSVKVHGHHHDYSRPLDVRWLCHTHHTEEHAALREAAAQAREMAREGEGL